MSKGKLLVLLVVLAAIAGLAAIRLIGENDGVPPTPAGRALGSNTFRGISLQLQAGYEGHPFETYIDEIAATGANTVAFVLAAQQENINSSAIFMDSRKMPSDSRLRRLIEHAHSRGLRVSLMPVVLLTTHLTPNDWRGLIRPGDWDRWWSEYRDVIIRLARIAAQTEVEVFLVGSELNSTVKYVDRWRALIAEVRGVYKGLVGYSSNWDFFAKVPFWRDLDFVGINCYFALCDNGKPDMRTMMESWARVKEEVLNFQAQVQRPIIFTEVGWPNQDTGAQFPWDYTRSDKPDPNLQALCFESFFQAWSGEQAVAGFYVWEWRNYPEQSIGPEDTSYVLTGKPALDVVKRYFAAQNRQSAPPVRGSVSGDGAGSSPR